MSVFASMRSYDETIDFRRVWKIGTTISLCVFAICAWALVARGLNLGLEFEGGTAWEVPSADLDVDDVRDALRDTGEESATIQVIGRGDGRIVRVRSVVEGPEAEAEVSGVLAEAAGVEEGDISVSTVGPSWGERVSDKAQRAMVWFLIVVSLYIAWRLEWKMAVGALASVVHDLVICVGIYALFQIEITPETVIAFLTILGYSLYDTIVVFDRMQVNGRRLGPTGKYTYTDIANRSLNQVLMRSVNSTIASLLPVLGMLFIGSFVLGASALEDFALALTVGIGVGAFSSILIASPLVAWIKDREPRYREARARQGKGRGPVDDPIPAGVPARADAGVPADDATTPSAAATPPPLSGRPIPPRPRKKGKSRR